MFTTDRDTSPRTRQRERFDRATAELDPPLAVVDLDAFDANANALVELAGGTPLRVASKSVRCRRLLTRVLDRPGWSGVLAFTLGEAIWLVHEGVTADIVVGYPTADRGALRDLVADRQLAQAITIMVDSIEQLDLIDSVAGTTTSRPEIRLCLELDASWRPLGSLVHLGVRRSPVHRPAEAGALAAAVAGRRGYRVVGLMSYEAQVAGLGDAPGRSAREDGVDGKLPGEPPCSSMPAARPVEGSTPVGPAGVALGTAIRLMQRRSMPELIERRAAAVAEIRRYADLEFVNGGGTGSVSATAMDPSVTEIAAGSGLFGPALFDGYRAWQPVPAAFFALDVVRRPAPGVVTVHGGGWIASGPPSRSRQPRPWLPAGLRLTGTEGAGEVQTPLRGAGTVGLRVGDRVWFRHAKAGELCEHVNELHLVSGDSLVATVPTYRGEGRAFL